jgi:hypothetical protein
MDGISLQLHTGTPTDLKAALEHIVRQGSPLGLVKKHVFKRTAGRLEVGSANLQREIGKGPRTGGATAVDSAVGQREVGGCWLYMDTRRIAYADGETAAVQANVRGVDEQSIGAAGEVGGESIIAGRGDGGTCREDGRSRRLGICVGREQASDRRVPGA